MFVLIFIMVAVILVDQLTKQLVVHFLDLGESVDVVPGVFRFTYIQNRGAAFGMLDEHRWIFMIISTVAIVALLIYLLKFAPQNNLFKIALALIIGGGIGNMIDRVFLGYVVDFLDFCAFPSLWKWIFNIADTSVCVGAGLVMLYLIIDIVKEAKKEKESKENE